MKALKMQDVVEEVSLGQSKVYEMAVAESPKTRMQVAISMALDLVDHRLQSAHRALLSEVDESGEMYAAKSLDLIDVALAEAGRVRGRTYADFDTFAIDLRRVESMCQGALMMYGDHTGVGKCVVGAASEIMDTLFQLVEMQEVV